VSVPALAKIRRMRCLIGADCMDCGWQEYDGTRAAAREHARAAGHKVHLVVEETTVYTGRRDS